MDHKLQVILAAKDVSGTALAKFKSSIGAVVKSVFSLRGAIVTLGGASGIGYLVKSSLSAADAIGKAADVAGITTKSLQQYHHAAGLSGVSTELLNSSFLAFNKRLGEVQAGTGSLTTYLKKYDLALLDSIKHAATTDDALALIFRRMGAMTNAADKAALAAAAFSRSGVKLTVMTKAGAAGLADMRDQANRLGLVIRDDLIRGAETANDRLDTLGRVLKTQVTASIIELAPEITEISTDVLKWVEANKEIIAQDIQGTFEAIAASISKVASAYKAVNKFLSVNEPANYLAAYAEGLENTLSAQKKQLAMYQRIGAAGSNAYETLNQRIELNAALLKVARDELAAAAGAAKLTTGGGLGGEPPPAGGRAETVPAGRWQPRADRGPWAPRAGGMVGVVAAEKKLLGEIEDATKDTYDTMDGHVQAYYDNIAEQAEKTAAGVDKLADRMSGAIADFATSGKFSFSDFAESIINDMIRIQARSMLTGIFSQVAGSEAGAGSFSFFADAKGGAYHRGGRMAFAAGGIVDRPTVFPFAGGAGIMGEAGPEAILPLTRLRGGDLGVKAAAGGSATQVIVNNHTSAPARVTETTDADGLRRVIVDIVTNDVLRGGPLAQAHENVYGVSRRGRIT